MKEKKNADEVFWVNQDHLSAQKPSNRFARWGTRYCPPVVEKRSTNQWLHLTSQNDVIYLYVNLNKTTRKIK